MLRSAANGVDPSVKAVEPAPLKNPKIAQLHDDGADDFAYCFWLFFRHEAGGGWTGIETNML